MVLLHSMVYLLAALTFVYCVEIDMYFVALFSVFSISDILVFSHQM